MTISWRARLVGGPWRPYSLAPCDYLYLGDGYHVAISAAEEEFLQATDKVAIYRDGMDIEVDDGTSIRKYHLRAVGAPAFRAEEIKPAPVYPRCVPLDPQPTEVPGFGLVVCAGGVLWHNREAEVWRKIGTGSRLDRGIFNSEWLGFEPDVLVDIQRRASAPCCPTNRPNHPGFDPDEWVWVVTKKEVQ